MFCRLLTALFLALALPAVANPIVVETLDLHASIPAPPWTEANQIASQSESKRERRLSERGTDVFLRAYVPKGQDFNDWRELYAIKAETPLAGDAENHRNRMAQVYQSACVNAILAPVLQEPARQVFVLYCPAYLDDPETGEFAVMVYSKSAETLVQVLYHKRVPAFDVTDRNSFPASRSELKALVEYLNQAHLIPS